MPTEIESLAATLIELRPFVPAKDYEVSSRFYVDLGFSITPLGDGLAEMRLGTHSFLLQKFYVKELAENFMMTMLVSDLALWWRHIAALDLVTRYGIPPPQEPKLQPWGLTVTYLIDPTGVLWHVAQVPAATH